MHITSTYDLVVVSSGAAGLSAALSYAVATADRSPRPRIALLERSTEVPAHQCGSLDTSIPADSRETQTRPRLRDHVKPVFGGLVGEESCKTLEREAPTALEYTEDRMVGRRTSPRQLSCWRS